MIPGLSAIQTEEDKNYCPSEADQQLQEINKIIRTKTENFANLQNSVQKMQEDYRSEMIDEQMFHDSRNAGAGARSNIYSLDNHLLNN